MIKNNKNKLKLLFLIILVLLLPSCVFGNSAENAIDNFEKKEFADSFNIYVELSDEDKISVLSSISEIIDKKEEDMTNSGLYDELLEYLNSIENEFSSVDELNNKVSSLKEEVEEIKISDEKFKFAEEYYNNKEYVLALDNYLQVSRLDNNNYERAQYRLQEFTGTVSGTITWQYNNFVGTKGDTGATVYLVSNKNNKLKLNRTESSVDFKNDYISTTADGNGNYKFDNVPVGTYYVVIKSKNTNRLDNNEETKLKPLLSSEIDVILFAEYLRKYKVIENVEVKYGQDTTISHDFGNTAF